MNSKDEKRRFIEMNRPHGHSFDKGHALQHWAALIGLMLQYSKSTRVV